MQAETPQTKSTYLHWHGLSKEDTNVLKAVFILMIVLHNFFHVFPRWNIENEFAFARAKFDFFKNELPGAGFFDSLGLLFSYFGHYGVQAFVFLSAYGLYLSYRNKKLRYWAFVKERVSKLYPAFFLAVLFYLAITIAATRSFHHPDLYTGGLLRLSLLSNLIPGKSFDLVGPWWFYSMIVQFYLLFPWLRRLFDRHGAWPLIVLSLLSCVLQLFFNDVLDRRGLLINTTVIGHLPVFSLGFILAKKRNLPMPLWVFVVAALLFYFGNYTQFGWVFTRIWVVVVMLYVYLFFKRVFPTPVPVLHRLLLFFGSVSMYIFAVNGFLRHPFMHAVLKTGATPVKLLITLGFVVFVVGVALVLRAAEQFYFRIVSKQRQDK